MTIIPYLHASCVEKDGFGVLLRGHAGAGKSSFALSLINRGFKLVADDQVRIAVQDEQLYGYTADTLKGLLEVRCMGILSLSHSQSCVIKYLIDLVPGFRSDRMPAVMTTTLSGIPLRSFQMNPMDPRSIEKILVLFHQDFLGFYSENDKAEDYPTPVIASNSIPPKSV